MEFLRRLFAGLVWIGVGLAWAWAAHRFFDSWKVAAGGLLPMLIGIVTIRSALTRRRPGPARPAEPEPEPAGSFAHKCMLCGASIEAGIIDGKPGPFYGGPCDRAKGEKEHRWVRRRA